MPDVDLGYALTLEPKDAVAYFRSKGYQITFDWHEMRDEAHAQAFTVAHAARLDVLEDIREAMDAVIEQGLTERTFAEALTPRLQAKGWWGKQVLVGADGGAEVVQMGSPHRLKTIYRTNMAAAFNAGRYKQQMESSDSRPFWQYVAVLDERTRSSHRAMHGKVFRANDPVWANIYPPNDFNCRCRVRALSQRALDRLGLSVDSSDGHLSQETVDVGTDKRTGEVITRDVTVWQGKDRAGRDVTFRTAPGWDHNPGAAAFGTDVEVMRKLTRVRDTSIRSQAIQALNNSALRQEQFARFADEVLSPPIAQRRPGHGAQTVHFMTEEVADFSRQHGIDPARVLVMREKDLVHADSQKHRTEGIALSKAELLALPALLVSARVEVYWDIAHQTVVYAIPDANGTGTILVPTHQDRKLKKIEGKLDQAVNAYRIDDQRLNNQSLWEKMP